MPTKCASLSQPEAHFVIQLIFFKKMRKRRLLIKYLIQLSTLVTVYTFACTKIAALVPSLPPIKNKKNVARRRHRFGSTERRGKQQQQRVEVLRIPTVPPPDSVFDTRMDHGAPKSTSITGSDDLYDAATQLLNLVLKKRDEEIENTFESWIKRRTSSYKDMKNEQFSQIESLIEQLTGPTLEIEKERKRKRRFHETIFGRSEPLLMPRYDPTELLFGSGFFCTLYWYYPNNNVAKNNETREEDPLWEQLSLIPSNIKGQQYYLCNNFQQLVINYSEILGSDIFVTAEGTLSPISSSSSSNVNANANTNKKVSFSDAFPSSSSSPVKNSRRLRTLPDVFKVDAKKISLSIFGFTSKFSIQGNANLVVLYTDPRIRIFVSPIESRSFVGNWEEAGLVVVQVRSGLVQMTANNENSNYIDLR